MSWRICKLALSHSPSLVMNGLVLCLDAGNRKSYPGSGTTWTDLSGGGNNGTLSGTFSNNSNNLGAVKFDAGDELLTVSNSSILSTTFSSNSFTIFTAVRSDNVVYPRSRHPLYVNQNPTSSADKGWSVGHGAASSSMEFRICDGTNLVNGFLSHSVVESTIYHRAFVVDRTVGANMKYYVNSNYIGQVDAPSVAGSIYTSGGLVLGDVWGWRYMGNIYFIQVYNRALTAQEIQQNFNALKGRFSI